MKSYFPKSPLGVHSALVSRLSVIPPALACDMLSDLASDGELKEVFSESSLRDFRVPGQPRHLALSDRARLLPPHCSIVETQSFIMR